MIKKYGKSVGDILGLKDYFIEDNDSLVEQELAYINFYKLQPKREQCKICKDILRKPTFVRKTINYYLCEQCGHLNGEFEDTDSFHNFSYTTDNPSETRREYQNQDLENYKQKVQKIYLPKAEFLVDSLKKIGEDVGSLSFLDIGCGVGHFVYGLKELGFKNVQGIDVSTSQVEFGNSVVNEKLLNAVSLEKTVEFIKNATSDVISFIMVLEHVQKPDEIFKAIKSNKQIKYVYMAVPMYSPSVLFQLSFEDVFERILYGGHTHLYSNSSIDYICKENSFEKKAEWRFGADFFDLYRSLKVKLSKNSRLDNSIVEFEKMFAPLIDKLQLVVDESELSSETHLLLKNL